MSSHQHPTFDSMTPTSIRSGMLRNSIYIGFNSPKVDDYHRTIFITYPESRDGTLFHAVCTEEDGWSCERREVNNISAANTLTLLHRIGQLPDGQNASEWFARCEAVLTGVDLDPNTIRDDDLVQRLGHPKLGGYSCVVWSIDAAAALAEAGIIDLKGESPEDFLMRMRLIAGPKDGTETAGQDHGPVRIMN